MLKYVDTKIVFYEIPEEITLAINISGCPIKCPDCHSKYLWDDIGEEINRESLHTLIENNKGITCVAFMGGDADTGYLQSMFYWVKTRYPELKVAWYSGREWPLTNADVKYLDYIKKGPFIKEKGPLNNRNTNQILYKIHHHKNQIEIENITNKFWSNDKCNNTGI